MKASISYLVILLFSCYVVACSMPNRIEQNKTEQKNAEQTKPFPVGDYRYTSYDTRGERVVEGQLSITSVEKRRIQSEESIQIKGHWQLNKVGNQERIGPQVGSGELVGSIIKGELYINLNTNMNDNNVFLEGTIEGRRFHGKWAFKGYAGTISEGTFEAVRE